MRAGEGPGPTYNLADLFESVADAVPARLAVVAGDRRLTYGALDERANRLAHHLAAAGIGPGDHVGLHLLNGTEYVEAMLACFKLRAVPINVNYRYVEAELRYLYDDADLAALVYHRQFGARIAAIEGDLPKLRHFVVVDDGCRDCDAVSRSVAYEDALAASDPARDFAGRDGDDVYCAYTGGTTGMPKGVVWRHEDIFFAAMGGGDPLQGANMISAPHELAERLPETGLVTLPTPPLMHVSAHWLAFTTLFGGGTVVLSPLGRFDPPAVWQQVADEHVNVLVIVGDAMARPLADALAEGDGRYDTSSLFVIGSGGAILSPSTKERLTALLPGVLVVDGFGSSETGTVGTRATASGEPATGPRFTVNAQTAVLDDHLQPVVPGSGVVGRLARRGHIPLGYYNDPDKTAATFATVDGVRWVLPGDMATVDADGTVVLLGRGSVSINTGGEKVYPEEVEVVVKDHPGVLDAVVVGVPDERWGERVVAVIAVQPGAMVTLDALQAHCRTLLAGYKVPREVRVVDRVQRSPSGKADYRWAVSCARLA